MEALGATASIIAVIQLSSEVAKYVRAASGAAEEKKGLQRELRSCEQILRTLVDEAGDSDEGWKWSATLQTLDTPEGPLGVIKAALATLRAKLHPESGLHRKVKGALAWPFQQKDIEKIVDVIGRQNQLLLIAQANDNRKLCQDIKKIARETKEQLDELTSHVENTLQGMTAIQDAVDHLHLGEDKRKSRQERQEILDWLTPVDYASQQNDFIARRQEGTGQWLLESAEFQEWKLTRGQTLFCTGMPGAGKTIMTSIVIDHLNSWRDSGAGLAYLYCNFRRRDKQTPLNLLESLLMQLSDDDQKWESVRDIVKSLYNRHKDRRSRPSVEEIFQALQSVSGTYSRVFAVIDAVDECHAPDGCLPEFIRRFQASCGANVFVTSRPVPTVKQEFKKATSLEIKADPQDVERYLQSQMSRLPGFVRRDPAIQEEIRTRITESVQGMFLLAQLHLGSLVGKRSRKAILTALSKLPTGSNAYDDSYSNCMERIEGQLADQSDLAKQTLSWITMAKRPLKTEELQHALATEIGEKDLDQSNISEIDDIVSACVGLVTVDEESGIIRLIHYTAQEYFERTHQEWFPNAEADLSRICIAYLSFTTFDTFIRKILHSQHVDPSQTSQAYPLFSYALMYWGHHSRQTPVEEALINFLLTPTKANLCGLIFLRHHPGESSRTAFGDWLRKVTGAHIAGSWGLHGVVGGLLSRGCDMTAQYAYGRSALSLAAEMGHTAFIAELMAHLDGDPGVDLGDVGGMTPLGYAAKSGHYEVVQLLLTTGKVEVNSRDNDGRTPLSHAAESGQPNMIGLLISSGAQVDSRNQDGRTPLSYAAEFQRIDMVRFLLQCGANAPELDCNLKGVLHLIIPSVHCNLELVDILLNAGAPTVSVDRENMTPLHYTVRQGRQDIAELLLRFGVPVNVAVQRKSHQEETGSDPTASSEDTEAQRETAQGLTPLHYAARVGSQEMVNFFISHGADVNFCSCHGETPLHLAISPTIRQSEHIATHYNDGWTERLWYLELQAYEDPESDEYTEIFKSATVERLRVIDALLDCSAVEINLQDSTGNSPLHLAPFGEYLCHVLVSKLLQSGADISLRNSKNETPLHLACLRGDSTSASLLLTKGASPSLTDQDGRTALHCAGRSGDTDTITQVLRSCGLQAANLCNAKDNTGGTAVHHAVRGNCNLETLQLLAGAGASVNSADLDGNTPLARYLSDGIWYTDMNVLQFLLSETDPCFVNTDGLTVAHIYTKHFNMNVAILKALQKAGVNLSASDRKGRTILHHGAMHGWFTEDIMTFVLEETTLALDTQDDYGMTPLQYSSQEAQKPRFIDEFQGSRWIRSFEIFKKYAI